MHSAPILISLLSAVSMVSAEVFELNLVPTATRAAALEERKDVRACASSVISELAAPSPKNDELADWVLAVTTVAGCTVTAPASLSSAYTSWFDELTDWAEDLKDNAAKQTDCGADTFSLTLLDNCAASKRTVLFTGEKRSDPTETHVEDKLPIPTNIKVGAASQSGVTRAGLALAVVVAFALAL
jgi:hypothetical protein